MNHIANLSELTNEAIDNLEAGPFLDRLIFTYSDLPHLWPYSTDIDHALQLVTDLTKPGREPQELWLDLAYHWREAIQAYACRASFKRKWQSDVPTVYDFKAKAPTIPLAICRAALKVWLAEQTTK